MSTFTLNLTISVHFCPNGWPTDELLQIDVKVINVPSDKFCSVILTEFPFPVISAEGTVFPAPELGGFLYRKRKCFRPGSRRRPMDTTSVRPNSLPRQMNGSTRLAT